MRSFVRCHGLLLSISMNRITNKMEGTAASSCCTGSIRAELLGRHASRVLVQHNSSLLYGFPIFVLVVVSTLERFTYALIGFGIPQIPATWREKERKTET